MAAHVGQIIISDHSEGGSAAFSWYFKKETNSYVICKSLSKGSQGHLVEAKAFPKFYEQESWLSTN